MLNCIKRTNLSHAQTTADAAADSPTVKEDLAPFIQHWPSKRGMFYKVRFRCWWCFGVVLERERGVECVWGVGVGRGRCRALLTDES